MYNFDASSIVDLWNNYPIQNPHFEPIWNWFSEHVRQKNFVISDIAFKEVKQKILYEKIEKKVPKSSDFIAILKDITIVNKMPSDLLTVQKIKSLLEIQEDNYHNNGVGENDLLIVANAKRNNAILVTNEAKQGDVSRIQIKAKYKIPAVCNLDEIRVQNMNLEELLHIETLW